ncbi:hypothetical protein EJC49_09090 [Aquibium carbonis]|uniref:Uncharacterized protein n=1 Tax=Aquibium carbonis TaxID=2495581 RepID=A0A3S0A9K0_9HYPH|nr:hypothetical protein [Aquibium carbonis]RST86717.1 hypothetical protein EJC49_09090 [Aquibium carbonis]
MVQLIGAERWAAMRSLMEGGLPTHQRVADCGGVYVKTLSRRAGQEGWKTLDFRHKRVIAAHGQMIALAASLRAGEEIDRVDVPDPEAPAGPDLDAELDRLDALPPAQRIARIGAMLTRRTSALLLRAEAGLPIEGRQVTALGGLVQLSERIATLAREEVRQEEARSEEELREALDLIDRRILHLAIRETRRLLLTRFGVSAREIDEVLPALEPF